ncbi:MAG: nucleotidyltransferase domain-containing protein [Oscillospiraceae bacterium]|jgi:predicted nucleotidyltransferase|nr:nucleotidyltransferase domain-containing protein [Oscillospiraceae bacterium]
MLDKATVRDIAARYAEEVRKVLNPDAVILFGSYVNGTPHEWSDIDIAVIVNDFDGNWLKTASMLFGLSWEVSLDIEPHLLDETHDASGFVEHVIKTGEVIYKAA